MAKKKIGIIKSIQKRLNDGFQVILRKDSDGVHPESFSRVVRLEGNSIRRTAFDALSTIETYDYKPGKYTVEHIEENERIHFFGTGRMLHTNSDEPCGCLCDPEEEFNEERDDEELDDGNRLVFDEPTRLRHRRLRTINL